MLRIIHFVQNLSLDITAGAVISCWFICDFLGVATSVPMLSGLGMAIWLIYTADHILDARKATGEIVNPRHAFHRKYQKPVVGIAVLVFVIGVYNAFQLPLKTIYYGLVLVGLSGLYFVYLKTSITQRFKESFAALVYTAGLFAGPLSLVPELNWDMAILAGFFFLLAYANLLVLPLFEKEIDEQQGVVSIATRQGDFGVTFFFYVTVMLITLGAVLVVRFSDAFGYAPFLFILMSWSLFALISKPAFFHKYQLYRIVGDGIFFLPGLLLL